VETETEVETEQVSVLDEATAELLPQAPVTEAGAVVAGTVEVDECLAGQLVISGPHEVMVSRSVA
jgi:hypothetical protein